MSRRFPLVETVNGQPVPLRADSLAPGTSREIMAGDQVLALFRVGDQFYALDGICPHAGGPLGEGQLNGSVVTCPWHGWQFDVTTGQNCLNARITQLAIPVIVEGGELFVEIAD